MNYSILIWFVSAVVPFAVNLFFLFTAIYASGAKKPPTNSELIFAYGVLMMYTTTEVITRGMQTFIPIILKVP